MENLESKYMPYRNFGNVEQIAIENKLIEITSPEQLYDILRHKDVVVVVEFYTKWCGVCSQIANDYQKLANKLGSKSVLFCKYNPETSQGQAGGARYEPMSENTVVQLKRIGIEISGFPLFHIFHNGPRAKVLGGDLKKVEWYVSDITKQKS